MLEKHDIVFVTLIWLKSCLRWSDLCSNAASYLVLVATVAALTGQYVVRKIIAIFGRASIIVFILAFTIFLSAIGLGTLHLSLYPWSIYLTEILWWLVSSNIVTMSHFLVSQVGWE